MRCKVLLVFAILVLSLPGLGEHGASLPEYRTRVINSFETEVNETTEYGNWSSEVGFIPPGNARVVRDSSSQYHGTYSARLNISVPVLGTMAWANLTFRSNSSKGYFVFDQVELMFRRTYSFGSWTGPFLVPYYFRQYHGSVMTDQISGYLPNATSWATLTFQPIWLFNTTSFELQIEMGAMGLSGLIPGYADVWVDMFVVKSSRADVRVRYWNLYTGLGYYEEKLLARYYSFPEGWIDVWRGEFQAYKGDEVLLQVTDIFERNVWTGIVAVDSDPVYVDILVPIVTVYIPKPDWYNESVPFEWMITCLPWGPDGPKGMELAATGFVFEVLAGWYNLAWFESRYAKAGNQSIYIDGNITEKRSYMLTDLSIPISPEYEFELKGGAVYDLANWDDFLAILGALWDDIRVKGILLLTFAGSAVVVYYRRSKRAGEIVRQQEDT